MEGEKIYFTADEAAKMLRLEGKFAIKTMRKHVLAGYVKPRSNGRDLLFTREDIDQLARSLGSRRARL